MFIWPPSSSSRRRLPNPLFAATLQRQASDSWEVALMGASRKLGLTTSRSLPSTCAWRGRVFTNGLHLPFNIQRRNSGDKRKCNGKIRVPQPVVFRAKVAREGLRLAETTLGLRQRAHTLLGIPQRSHFCGPLVLGRRHILLVRRRGRESVCGGRLAAFFEHLRSCSGRFVETDHSRRQHARDTN